MLELKSKKASTPRRGIALRAVLTGCSMLVTGCASGGGLVDKGLDMIGLAKRPDLPAMPDATGASNADLSTLGAQAQTLAASRPIALRVHAGELLNTDPGGRSLSLVLRIYKLRATRQFMQATYPAFAAAAAVGLPGGDDVISVKEIVLVPGQKYEVLEPMPREAAYLAVVALFRAPDSQRWRFVFDAKAAARSGVTLGAHGCAMSVAAGDALGAPPEVLRLAGVQCG